MRNTLPLRIVSFNAWGLPITIPSQAKRRRLAELPARLAELGADVIVLQELFDIRARRELVRELCPPYSTTPEALETRRIAGLVHADVTGGLLVLSRLPIASNRFIEHSLEAGARLDERLGRKGSMILRLETPIGPLSVVVVHLYAGPHDSRFRAAQLARLLEITEREADGSPVVLAGDVNASPTVAFPEPPGPQNDLRPEYAALAHAGFTDPMPPNPTPPERCVTWVPSRNRYAGLPYQVTKTDERYDYVLVRPGRRSAWSVRAARTIFDQPETQLSDHHGVLADLDLIRSGG